ncbi:MAG: hypothetical protein ABSC95_19040 [Acetobacteraceae bacterium]|jgi:hypothetical protein
MSDAEVLAPVGIVVARHAAGGAFPVFEAVSTPDAKPQRRTMRLASRRPANGHGPRDMAIPRAKIAFNETVGPEPSVGKAMAGAPAK